VSRGGDLLRLQEVDTRLAHEAARLRDVEAAIAGDPEIDRRRREARALRRARTAAEAELTAAEHQVDALRARVRELDRHLYGGSVRNPQELLTMQHELTALRARVDTEDDSLLELMQNAESAAAAERDANAAVVDLEQDRADHAGDLLAEVASLRAALEQDERDRAQVTSLLDAPDLSLYDRLRRRVQPAVVRVVNDSCGGCHIPFAASEVRRIRLAEAPVQCPGCDRIVVS
jgi:predicted  nucleic acid-binding Zn-ribbon protein